MDKKTFHAITSLHARELHLRRKNICFGGRSKANLNDPNDYREIDLSTAEVYDPLMDSWQTLAPMKNPNTAAVCAESNGLMYLFGGRLTPDTYEIYNPKTDSWLETGKLPTRMVVAHGAQSLGGKIYITGDYVDKTKAGIFMSLTQTQASGAKEHPHKQHLRI